MIDTCLGEGPLVVERKGSAIYTSCAEVPTKMLCTPMPSCSSGEVARGGGQGGNCPPSGPKKRGAKMTIGALQPPSESRVLEELHLTSRASCIVVT